MMRNMWHAAADSPFVWQERGVIGSIIVSGLDHMADHEFAVACISQYLRVDEIPRLPVRF